MQLYSGVDTIAGLSQYYKYICEAELHWEQTFTQADKEQSTAGKLEHKKRKKNFIFSFNMVVDHYVGRSARI